MDVPYVLPVITDGFVAEQISGISLEAVKMGGADGAVDKVDVSHQHLIDQESGNLFYLPLMGIEVVCFSEILKQGRVIQNTVENLSVSIENCVLSLAVGTGNLMPYLFDQKS